MAEFRKLFYALGVAALFTGLASTASAQSITCASSAVPPIIRAEGFTELVGDYVLDCTGGVSTFPGQPVPQVNITVTLNAPITSRLLGANTVGNFTEALLIIDEPNSALVNRSTRPLMACGQTGAPDNSPSGLGVCGIIAPADADRTYDGLPDVAGPGAGGADATCDGVDPDYDPVTNTTGPLPPRPANSGTFGCGRPNVFQGRQAPNQPNVIVFNGVPFNPPGLDDGDGVPHRILRFTNFRVAPQNFAAGSLVLQTITMSVNINSSMSIQVTNREVQVASVLPGISLAPRGTAPSFVQCSSPSSAGLHVGNARPVVFREGFASSFKTKGLEQITGPASSSGNGVFSLGGWRLRPNPFATGAPWVYNVGTDNVTGGVRQNVPGTIYNTESGFTSNALQVNYSSTDGTGQNPPLGLGYTTTVTGGAAISNSTGIANAGIATQGTRISIRFADIPRGVTMTIPTVAFLYRAGEGPTTTNVIPTGVAVRTVAGARGDGGYSPASGTATPTSGHTTTSTATSNLLTYEVLFNDPAVVEDFYFPVNISYTPNLSSNLPDITVNTVPTASGGFAPFIDLSLDSSTVWSAAQFASPSVTYGSTTLLPIPRFKPLGTDKVELFRIGKCACNLLFPFVTNFNTGRGNYDTGVAIANTSLLPGTPGPSNQYGFLSGAGQQGPVQLWYFPADPSEAAQYATQCTNAAVGGPCPGTKDVPVGGSLLFSIAAGNPSWGIEPRAGFTGYMVAQTAFQYCHAFAYISAQGAAPADPGMSVGYVALQLDQEGLAPRTAWPGESLGH